MLKTFLQSSQDPTVIATKVKGAILAVASIIMFLALHLLGITLTANDVGTLATEISTLVGAIWTIYGCVLHLITWWGTIKHPVPPPTV